MKYANNGKSTVCGEWTSEIRNHFKVSVSICSDNDRFNKRTGKLIAHRRLELGYSIVLPAKSDGWGNIAGLKEQLKDFLYVNC
jgi:hypothetical protein